MELQKDLLRFSSNCTQVVAEGSGHGVPLQRPDVIVDCARRIVQKARESVSAAAKSAPTD
jgi:hypothetical protein